MPVYAVLIKFDHADSHSSPKPIPRRGSNPDQHLMSVPYRTKVALALRSGNTCAMPLCGQLLSEPRGNEFVLLGEAAHIAGEHGGGKRGRPSVRFDPEMTEEERNSLSNLLYLCRDCHVRIDAHPHREREYSVDRLLTINAEHEGAVAAAMDEAMAAVGFAELETATRWVTEVTPPRPGQDFSRIPIADKIRKHGLSVSSRNLIRSHLAAAPQVRSFIQSLSQDDPGFPERLIAGFLEHYYKLRRESTSSGEDLFDSMCMFARRGFGDLRTQFAAQAVLVYLWATAESHFTYLLSGLDFRLTRSLAAYSCAWIRAQPYVSSLPLQINWILPRSSASRRARSEGGCSSLLGRRPPAASYHGTPPWLAQMEECPS